MKNKKSVIITIVVILVLVISFLITYNILTDSNKITADEKKWINANISKKLKVNVLNNVNIMGNVGSGVFYEFINDFEAEYNLEIVPSAYNLGEDTSGITLGLKNNLGKDDTIFYTDHYVLVSKNAEVVANYNNFVGKKIGVLSEDVSYISKFLTNNQVNLVGLSSREQLLNDFKEGKDVDYIIVPLTVYFDEILRNDYYIVNHLSDAKLYYTITGSSNGNDNVKFTSVLRKFYNNWAGERLDEYFKREELALFLKELNISEAEIDNMRSITYNYGFVNNSPYEVLMSGNYGGIVAVYLSEFGEFSGIDFNFQKYKNINKFKKALTRDEVDLYFNYYDIDNFNSVDSKILLEYSVVAKNSNKIVVNSLNSLINNTVYVEENSLLYNYLEKIDGIKLEVYESEADIKKLNKKDAIIVMDKNVFNLYKDNTLSNYTERYSGNLNKTYDFKIKNNNTFYKLFSKYVMTLDNKEMVYKGMYNYLETAKTGSILGTIAKYILLTIVVFSVLFILVYKSSKKVKIAKKIKKENKIKFIDQLTSLKNRNYLNEYINNWNNNTIYPQTMIVIDLNNIQFINDTLGYEEGDKQIKAVANILIKTQLDNSDIMRTDGNEFLIYLVGYTQKQVTNYIHKLNKEFKKLPYEYGGEFGYSMINDNIKTIEDAILEATDDMKKQKKIKSEVQNDGKSKEGN